MVAEFEECPDNLIHYFLVGVGCSSPKSVQFSRPYTHNPTTMMADHWLSLLLVLAYYCPLMPRRVPLHTLRCQRNSPAAAAFMRIRTTAQPTPRPLGPLLELCPLIYPLQLGPWVSLPPNGALHLVRCHDLMPWALVSMRPPMWVLIAAALIIAGSLSLSMLLTLTRDVEQGRRRRRQKYSYTGWHLIEFSFWDVSIV